MLKHQKVVYDSYYIDMQDNEKTGTLIWWPEDDESWLDAGGLDEMDDLDGSARTRLRQDSEKLRQGGVQVEGSGARYKGYPHSGREPRMPLWSDPSQENS